MNCLMKIYNTLTRKLEEFEPVEKGKVKMYNCGPTVYFHMHLGNLRAYTFVDVLRRTLEYLGYEVIQVMNLTDVGHLTSDEDSGEDKLENTAKKENKDVWEVAEFYIDSVKDDFEDMNFKTPNHWPRATDHIQEMIDFNKKIEEHGFAYETEKALYFDVTKYDDYTRLQGGQSLDDKQVGVRDDVNVDSDKRHPADFALWIKAVGEHENHIMRWDSPWGVGFPGWHIECSAMGVNYLGTDMDIHTGGEDHIPLHHTNERAQNYGAFEKEVVKYWMHNKFLKVDGGKMGKSRGNMYELGDIRNKGYDPMDLRFFFLQANYRTGQNFTWQNMDAAKAGRENLIGKISQIKSISGSNRDGEISEVWKEKFVAALENDLNTPEALAAMWGLLKDPELPPADKLATVLDFDRVFGLRLNEVEDIDQKITEEMKEKVEQLIAERRKAREEKDWNRADEIRDELNELGVVVEDTKDGAEWHIK